MKGFKEFLLRGNLIELAVALIMATVFAKVVEAFSNLMIDVVAKIIATLFGVNLTGAFSSLTPFGLPIGAFLSAVVMFILTGFVIYFFIVKPYDAYRTRRGTMPLDDATETELLAEIRDLLASGRR